VGAVEALAAMASSDCEQLRSGWLAQPANAISCAAFLAAGYWLLTRTRNSDEPRALLLTGAAAMFAVGVGSVAYHGPQPHWADPLHSWSANALALVVAVQTARLLISRLARGVLAAWKASSGWIVAGLIAYVAGRTGSRWCRPDTLWQMHAVWHVLIAGGVARLVAGYSSAMRKASVSG
jgi:hypothetical protein